jgi:multidrug efflux pump subunit AcrA (membrane-fusion protein)
VEPVVEKASRSFEVVGTARVDDPAVKPGRFATVTLTTPEPTSTLWLPATAVATSDLPQVYTVTDGRLVDHKVQTGRRDDGSIEIVSGLSPSDQVVADVAGLHRGLPVTVIE